jgi:hypothetical protein
MPSSSQRIIVKFTIAKLLSFAYDHDSKFVAAVSREKPPSR